MTWVGVKTTEEVHRIASLLAALLLLIWGFAVAPESVHLLIEGLLMSLYGALSVKSLGLTD